jgi:predicted secreted protein
MSKINASDLLVYIGADNTLPIAHSTSATLNIEQDLPDATTKDSGGWADHINGLKSWSLDFDGLVDYAASYGAEELSDNLTNGNNLIVRWSTTIGSYWQGTASLSSLTMSADMESPLTYSGTFTGKGFITRTAV